MLLEDHSSLFVTPNYSRKRRKRRSLYYLSPKVLKRVRMTRGEKAVSKTNRARASELYKSFHFEGGASSNSIGARGRNLEVVHEETHDTSVDHEVIGKNNISNISLV